MASVNCVNCGAANEAGRMKCSYCGSPLPGAQGPVQPPMQQPQMQPPPGPQFAGPFAPPPQMVPPQMMGQPVYMQPVMMAPGAVHPMALTPQKSKVAAALLAFLLGPIGIHNFYLGHTMRGIIQLVLTMLALGSGGEAIGLLYISGLWAFVEFILILTGSLKDKAGRPLV